MINVEYFESIQYEKFVYFYFHRNKILFTWLFPTSSFHKCFICSTPANVVNEFPLQLSTCKYSYWGTWNKVTRKDMKTLFQKQNLAELSPS